MLTVILTIIGVVFIAELIKLIAKALKLVVGIILSIIGIILIVALFIHAGPMLLSVLPYILLVIGILLIGYLMYSAISSGVEKVALKKEIRKYKDWLDSVGIGAYKEAPGSRKSWDIAVKQRCAIKIDNIFAISIPFSEAIVREVHVRYFIRQTDLLRIARSLIPDFRSTYIQVLMSFLESKNQIRILTPYNRQKYCIASDLILLFEQILLDNDCIITMADLRKICAEYAELSFLQDQDDEILKEILKCVSLNADKLVVQRALLLQG